MIRTACALGISLLAFTSSVSAQNLTQEQFNQMLSNYLSEEKNLNQLGGAVEEYFQLKQAKMEKEKFEQQFSNRQDIDVSGSPSMGPDDAKITLVEFSDFECPYCSRGKAIVEQVRKAYPKDVKVVFKHFPLSFHKNAKPAARAAMAAHEQGKFWEMHDMLFKNQRSLNQETYIRLAKQLDLDLEKFKADLDSGKYDKQIDKDMQIGTKAGIRGTPGFAVNGVMIRGAVPFAEFKKVIDRLLKEDA